jgi:phosphatidylglycerol---prolipoprotein diacylglyceryl transferase
VQPEIDLLGIPIKTFGLMFGLAFVSVGLIIARRLRETDRPVDWAYEMVFAALVGGIIGARGWWLVQNWSDAKQDLLGNVFGGSGLVWYGGLLGGAAGILLWARRRNMLNGELLTLCTPALALGYAVGRVGCQISGDGDYGKAWNGPWAMAYPNGVVPTTQRVHPTPIYETVSMGLVALLLWSLRDRMAPSRLFALYLLLAGGERFLVEFLRRNSVVALGLTLAQLFSASMILAGAAWLVRTRGGTGTRPRIAAL